MLSPADTFEHDVVTAMPLLRRLALTLCKNVDRADDLVQETVLRALLNRSQYAPGSNLIAWLTVIQRNLFLSRTRRSRREVEDPDDVMALSLVDHANALRKIEAREVLVLIDKMPAHFREPLRLIADGASYEEVASELREHVGTVKSRVNRGRALLRIGT